MSYYPPGHPTGVFGSEVTVTCPKCEVQTSFRYSYDASTNAGEYLEGDPTCRCDYEFTDDELRNGEWD